MVVEHTLPDRQQLEAIAREIATEENELPDDAELETILDAAAGLTRLEAENAFSLSLGSAWLHRTGCDLGIEGGDAEEVRSHAALSWRR